jgi:pimeloyl-ACP methyl ester carboxylesterase
MFEATDGVALSGVLFEPWRRTRTALIFLHGTGGTSVFNTRRTNLLGRELVSRRIAFFAFDNRGSHVVRRLKGSGRLGGMAFERIRDCVFDIDGAIRELRRRGYREFLLAGHSTGANKIAVYNARKPRNPVRRYILLGGGDDTGLVYDKLGARRFRSALATARARIKSGDGARFLPESLAVLDDAPMSWRSFYDLANPDGDYNVFPFLELLRDVRLSRKPRFRHLRTIRKPALVLYGDRDEYCYDDVSGCAAVLAAAVADRPNIEIAVLRDTDHGFTGREGELAQLIAGWAEPLRPTSRS